MRNVIAPVKPTFEVPVLNVIPPDTPADSMFAVLITTEPDDELALVPLVTNTGPPCASCEAPPLIWTAPPTPADPAAKPPTKKSEPPLLLFPLPTAMLTEPPRPPLL